MRLRARKIGRIASAAGMTTCTVVLFWGLAASAQQPRPAQKPGPTDADPTVKVPDIPPTEPAPKPANPGSSSSDRMTEADTAIQRVDFLRDEIKKRTTTIQTVLELGDLSQAQSLGEQQQAAIKELEAETGKAKALIAARGRPQLGASDAGAAQAAETADSQKVEDAAKQAKDSVDGAKVEIGKAVDAAGCLGKSLCLFGGASLAGFSLTSANTHRSGQTGHRVIQLLVPTIGIRYAWLSHISLDLGIYTAIVSPQLELAQTDRTGSGCTRKPNAFEDALPCEGSANLRPYIAGLAGFTVGTGSSSMGILTIGVTGGLARTTQDPTAAPFGGLMVTTAGVYTTVPLAKRSK